MNDKIGIVMEENKMEKQDLKIEGEVDSLKE